MKDIKYGVLTPVPVPKGYNLRAFVTNLYFTDDEGVAANDAALLICRRSFGYGITNIALLRKKAHQVLTDTGLADVAENVADTLWSGAAGAREHHIIMDCILNSLDTLVYHPPEKQDLNRKAVREFAEQYGLAP